MPTYIGENLVLQGVTTPGAPTVDYVGVAGTTHYGYKVVGFRGGAYTAASSETLYTLGYTSLSPARYAKITPDFQQGITRFDIYRTTGGSNQGKIGSVVPQNVNGVQVGYLLDVGQDGDDAEAPTVGTAGELHVESGRMFAVNFPTADPMVENQVWLDAGVMTVSEGA